MGQHQAELRGLVEDDGRARLYVGRLHVGHESALYARAEAVVQLSHVYGRPVGGQNYLVPGLVDAVEGVERLLLRAALACDELYVVHQQQVYVAVLVAELLAGAGHDRVYKLVGEVVALQVGYLEVRPVAVDLLAYGQQQMRLAETRVAVDEQGVIHLARVVGHGDGRCVGKLVGRADYKAVEGVAVHLRVRRGLGAAGLDVVHQLVPRQHLEVEVTGKQVV